MNRADIEHLLLEAKKITKHPDYVIIGSLSVFGAIDLPPDEMARSIDVDLYPLKDPGRASEIASELGEDSDFATQYGYYADAVSPKLPTLPEGWENRLNPIVFASGVTAHFLDVNDAAISKYFRGSSRDREWIRAGLASGILLLPTIEYRLRQTISVNNEMEAVKKLVAEDKEWLRQIS